MDGMPASAAEILVDEVRMRIAPTRIDGANWFRIVDAAMEVGLHIPWVGMVIGFGETPAQRVEHLLRLRAQQKRGLSRYGRGFAAFKVWPARLAQSRLRGKAPSTAGQEVIDEYLRWVSISRLALDNVANHRTVWRTMGFGVAGEALQAGADDICGAGSINAINAVMAAAGGQPPESTQTLVPQIVFHVVRTICDAGFVPAERDPHYNIVGYPDVRALLSERNPMPYIPGVGFIPGGISSAAS